MLSVSFYEGQNEALVILCLINIFLIIPISLSLCNNNSATKL